MKVKKLIEYLQKCDQKAEVRTWDTYRAVSHEINIVSANKKNTVHIF